METARFEDICRRRGLRPIGKAALGQYEVLVAERQIPGIVLSTDPIECQTHYEIAWALKKGNDGYGNTVKVRAIEVPDQPSRIKIALAVAADHLSKSARGSRRTH